MSIKYNGKFLQVHVKPYDNSNYEIVEMNNAVAVIPINQYGQILLVKQYRPVCKKYTYEIPAGMLDVDGELIKETMCRELVEEANLEISPDSLVHLIEYFPIIGSVNHKITIYKTEINNCDNKSIENDDVIERLWVSQEDLNKMIEVGEIIDGKTLLAYSMIKNNKDMK